MGRLLVITTLLLFACLAKAQNNNCPNTHGNILGGDDRPWPWGNEEKLTWREISGIWQAAPDCDSYFLIKVIESKAGKGQFIINIAQVERGTCRIIAQGTGFGSESETVARAAMNGVDYNFSLTIRAVKVNDQMSSKQRQGGGISYTNVRPAGRGSKIQHKITIFPNSDWNSGRSYVMKKLSNNTATCANYVRDYNELQ